MPEEETDGKNHGDNGFNQSEPLPRVSPSASQNNNEIKVNKGKSCKGCLYYSSAFKSSSRNPLCVGITRSLPSVPRYIVGEAEMDAAKKGRSLSDFKYGCVGYSVYPDLKDRPPGLQDSKTELPVCVGLEILADRRLVSADSAAAHARKKGDSAATAPSGSRKPSHSVGDEFFSRFTRNAGLVAMGVAKNLRRVGNQIKESVDDILFPYRRRPK